MEFYQRQLQNLRDAFDALDEAETALRKAVSFEKTEGTDDEAVYDLMDLHREVRSLRMAVEEYADALEPMADAERA